MEKPGFGWSGISDGETTAPWKFSMFILLQLIMDAGLLHSAEHGGGLLHTDKTWRQDYYIQVKKEADLVINLIGSSLQATNIQEGEKYIGWTFSVHTVNICIQTQGRLYHPSESFQGRFPAPMG